MRVARRDLPFQAIKSLGNLLHWPERHNIGGNWD